MSDWKPVANALLGSWPSQVTSWGKEGIAAFVAELEARHVSPDQALVAIRSCPAEQKFPPSAPELAALARQDPSRPTFDEAYQLIYGRRGVLRARAPYVDGEYEFSRDEAARRRARELGPWVEAFVSRYGLDRLRLLEVDHPDFGDLKRKELRQSFEQFVEASEGREVASLAVGRRGEMGRLDPLAALGLERPAITEGAS